MSPPLTEQPICRICQQPVIGEAALDPVYHPDALSYLHPACRTVALQEEKNRRRQLARAAPALLMACKAALADGCKHGSLSDKTEIALRRAIASAEGSES